MSLAIAIQGLDASGPKVRVWGTLTPSGSYVTGGDTIDFTTAAAQLQSSRYGNIISQQPPDFITVQSTDGTYLFFAKPGTAQNNGLFSVFSALGTQLAAGAYPAGILAETLNFEAVFPKMQ